MGANLSCKLPKSYNPTIHWDSLLPVAAHLASKPFFITGCACPQEFQRNPHPTIMWRLAERRDSTPSTPVSNVSVISPVELPMHSAGYTQSLAPVSHLCWWCNSYIHCCRSKVWLPFPYLVSNHQLQRLKESICPWPSDKISQERQYLLSPSDSISCRSDKFS